MEKQNTITILKKGEKKLNIYKVFSLIFIILYIIILVKNNNRYININIACYILIFLNTIYILTKQQRVIKKKGGKK